MFYPAGKAELANSFSKRDHLKCFIQKKLAAIKSRTRKVVTGRDAIIGASAEVLDDFADRGLVRLHAEIWQARSRTPLTKGTRVRIVGMDDLVLTVEPQEQR